MNAKNLVSCPSIAWGALKPLADPPFSPPDSLQRELTTTCHLLGELGIGSLEENLKALNLLSELKEMTQKKDLELRRYFRKDFKSGAACHTQESRQLWFCRGQGCKGPLRRGGGGGVGKAPPKSVQTPVCVLQQTWEKGGTNSPSPLLPQSDSTPGALGSAVHILSVSWGDLRTCYWSVNACRTGTDLDSIARWVSHACAPGPSAPHSQLPHRHLSRRGFSSLWGFPSLLRYKSLVVFSFVMFNLLPEMPRTLERYS